MVCLKTGQGEPVMDIMEMGQEQPRFLGAWDFPGGQDIVLTVREIHGETSWINGQRTDVTVCEWAEPYRPMVLNITNKKTLAQLAGTTDTDRMRGMRVLIGVEQIRMRGAVRPALRIRPVHPDASQDICCTDCGKPVQGYGKMDAGQVAAYTGKKYGRVLCSACAEQIAKGSSSQK